MNIEPITIDLLRHGAVEGVGWSFRGSTDVALSAEGWSQMEAQYDAMPTPFHTIVTSPMQRCRLFSQKMQLSHPESKIQLIEDLKEMDFGDWEGVNLQEIEDEPELKRFWNNPVGVCPPNGESFDDFVTRVTRIWQCWLTHDAQAGNHYLIVAHGGVIRVLLAYFLGMPMPNLWSWHMPYASWSRVSILQDFPARVIFVNR